MGPRANNQHKDGHPLRYKYSLPLYTRALESPEKSGNLNHFRHQYKYSTQPYTFIIHTIYQSRPKMSSPSDILTIASDVVVLGAAVTVAGVGIKSITTKYSNSQPQPIKSTLGENKRDDKDDDLI